MKKDDLCDYLTPYEQRIYKGFKKTKSDLLKDERMVSNVVRGCLGVEVSKETLETGEEINVPIIVELVAKKLDYLREHPEKVDLKELSSVLGETKVENVVKEIPASQIFKGINEVDEEK